MKLGFPSILCAVERTTRESISAVLSEYDLRFAENEFEAIDLARRRESDLILMSCRQVDDGSAKACQIIRVFDDQTPVLFLGDSSRLTEEEALSVGAQGLLHEHAPNFAYELKRRVSELIDNEKT
jgi:CheY-like chemotaxis protein